MLKPKSVRTSCWLAEARGGGGGGGQWGVAMCLGGKPWPGFLCKLGISRSHSMWWALSDHGIPSSVSGVFKQNLSGFFSKNAAQLTPGHACKSCSMANS